MGESFHEIQPQNAELGRFQADYNSFPDLLSSDIIVKGDY